MSQVARLRILCTNRGAHGDTSLRAAFDPEQKRYTTECGRCGRRLDLQQRDWLKLRDELAKIGIRHFDISTMKREAN